MTIEVGQWYTVDRSSHWAYFEVIELGEFVKGLAYPVGSGNDEVWSITRSRLADPKKYTLVKKPYQYLSSEEVKSLSDSGMLFEFYPEACEGYDSKKLEVDPLMTRGGINYVFREDDYFEEIMEYINSTYNQHYASNKDKLQTTQLISKIPERGINFCIGNMMKYSDRFGLKDGYNRKDILKVIHYSIIALCNLDNMDKNK